MLRRAAVAVHAARPPCIPAPHAPAAAAPAASTVGSCPDNIQHPSAESRWDSLPTPDDMVECQQSVHSMKLFSSALWPASLVARSSITVLAWGQAHWYQQQPLHPAQPDSLPAWLGVSVRLLWGHSSDRPEWSGAH